MTAMRKYWIALIFSGLSLTGFAQHDHEQHAVPATGQHENAAETGTGQHAATAGQEATAEHGDCGHPIDEVKEGEFNAGETAVHHIADANAVHIFGNFYLHLPCILYAPGHGWTLTSTSAFHPHHHGNGEVSKNGYVLVHGNVMRIKDPAFATGAHEIEGYTHKDVKAGGKTKTVYSALIGGQCHELDAKTTFDGGIMGGGITSFYDYSVTRNVFTMLLTAILLFLLFRIAATTAMRQRDRGIAGDGKRAGQHGVAGGRCQGRWARRVGHGDPCGAGLRMDGASNLGVVRA